MANLIVITGPQAVGKMTVAEKLVKKIDYHLMVNHDSLEVSAKIFGWGSDLQKELSDSIRNKVFSLVIDKNLNLIFTFVTAFDLKEDIDYLNNLKDMFEGSGGNFYFVELKADLETRLERNITPHRLESKLSKNDIERSNKDLIETNEKYRLNSLEGEQLFTHHIKINNTNLNPEEVANIIIHQFGL